MDAKRPSGLEGAAVSACETTQGPQAEGRGPQRVGAAETAGASEVVAVPFPAIVLTTEQR